MLSENTKKFVGTFRNRSENWAFGKLFHITIFS